MPRDAKGSVSFGAITQDDLRPVSALFARHEQERASVDAWHGALNIENANYGRAADLLAQATKAEPTQERWVLLGDAQLLNGHPADAVESYTHALSFGPNATAEKGLAWALVGIKDYDGAIRHFTKARDAFAMTEHTKPRPGYLDTVRGLAVATGRKGDCAAASAYMADVIAEDPASPASEIDGCK
jgi:tetratricopeptide (TPR) repeat protein